MTTQLTFQGSELALILGHAERCPIDELRPTIDQQPEDELWTDAPPRWDGKPQRGIWVVGDSGVYIMSNGNLRRPPDKDGLQRHVVCYANECNPDTMEFDEWWAVKGDTFGHDDGVCFIPLEDVRGATKIAIRFRAHDMILNIWKPRRAA